MTDGEFNQQMQRLVTQFGKAAYSPERVVLIADAVMTLPIDRFRRIVDDMIGSCRQAPLLPDFRDAVARQREYEAQKHKVVSFEDYRMNNPRCTYCGDNGVYLCKKGKTPGVFAFRCHCDTGRSDSRNHIPQFKSEHARDGFTYYELGGRR